MSVTLSRLNTGQLSSRRINDLLVEIEAKLAKILATTVAIANTGTPNGVAHVTGQVKDALGNALAGRFLVTVSLGSAAYGAPVDLGTATAAANTTILKADTADAFIRLVTHSDGSWGVDLDLTVDGTVHVAAAVSGAFVASSAAITGN